MRARKVLKLFLIFILAVGWVFSGWPQIWHDPPIPPDIQKAQAQGESLTFIVKSASTETFPDVTPGTVVATTTILEVNTDNPTGFYITVVRDDSDSTLDDNSDASNNISDKTAWSAPAATTTAGNATASTTEPQTLQFRVRLAGTDELNYASVWWGNDDTTANALFAGFPSSAQKIVDRSVDATASTTIYVLYNLDVPSTQKTGTYSGSITYTAMVNP